MASFEQQLKFLSAELNKITAQIEKLKAASSSGGAGDPQIAALTVQYQALIALQKEYIANKAREAGASSGVKGRGPGIAGTPAGSGGGTDPAKLGRDMAASTTKGIKAAEKAAREQERAAKAIERKRIAEEKLAQLAAAQARIANDPRYGVAYRQAVQRGYSKSDLTSIDDRGGGVERLRFARQEGGKNMSFNPYVSKSGGSTPGLSSQYRSVGSDILRDIGQFAKWSIAVAAIYTPLQKLGELMTDMVDVQSRLADATIAANIPFDRSNEIFEQVYNSANLAGEGLAGVIDAYAQAYRSAGRYSDQQQRNNVTTVLLNDSLTLSKLSTLDQAGAIDTLSAALLQSDLELDRGQDLLNKWVRVSQVANVDITGLATGVAVLGDSAQTAGLDIDELNGLIAVLSEQSISGSKEAANTAKALVGSYQSDKAEQTLTKYGFALRRANGEAREFLDVYQELALAREQGLLSPAAISELSLALGGGGNRRAKDASALINGQDRLLAVAKESRDVAEDSTLAQDSLGKKLETVETASTRLSNSFLGLAQTLGDDGGLLDSFKNLLNFLTAITTGFDHLFELLGRSGPILTTTLTGLFALSKISPERTLGILSSLGGRNYGGGQFIPGGGRAPAGGVNVANSGTGFVNRSQGALGNVLLAGTGQKSAGALKGGALVGALAVGAAETSNIRQGETDRAAGNVIGATVGAAIGGYLGGPAGLAIGATIGSSVGESFVKGVLEYDSDFANFFRDVMPKPETSSDEAPSASEAKRKDLADTAFKESGYGPAALALDLALVQIDDAIGDALGDWARVFPNIDRGTFTKETLIGSNISKDTEDTIRREQALSRIQDGEYETRNIEDFEPKRKQLQDLANQERQNQLQRLSSGEITPSQFGKTTEQLAGFPVSAIRSVEAYGEAFVKASGEIDNVESAYKEFLYIATYGNEEQIKQLSQYTTDINSLQYLISNFDDSLIGTKLKLSFGEVDINSPGDLAKILEGVQTQAGATAAGVASQLRVQETQIPGIVGSATEATSRNDINLIASEAQKIQAQFYNDMELSDDAVKNLVSNLDDFAVLVGDAAENHFDTISGIDQKFWDAATKILEEQNKLQDKKGIGFQKFDVPYSQLKQLADQSLVQGQQWKDKYNYDFKPEDQIAIDNTGAVNPLHADFKILALLLEKIVDQGQKQLDGQYNIPEGATFWVPLSAAYYKPTNESGGGSIDTSSLDGSAMNLDASAEALKAAAAALTASKIIENDNIRQFKDTKRAEGLYTGDAATKKTIGTTPETDAAMQLYRQGEKDNYYSYLSNRAPTTGAAEPFGNNGPDFSGITQSLDVIKNIFESLSTTFSNLFPQSTGENQNSSLQAKLDFQIDNTTNLTVDGRILASIITPYLASDLLRIEASQGTVTRKYII